MVEALWRVAAEPASIEWAAGYKAKIGENLLTPRCGVMNLHRWSYALIGASRRMVAYGIETHGTELESSKLKGGTFETSETAKARRS